MKHFAPRKLVLLTGLLVFCLAVATNAGAQTGAGTLTGLVVDDQGAAIPGALVTVTEQATGAIRTTQSGPDGGFRIAGLLPGRFTVEVTLAGFAPLKITDVPLAPTEVR